MAQSPGLKAGRGLKPTPATPMAGLISQSPGLKAGRGLKRHYPLQSCSINYQSPGLKAGRGLKHIGKYLQTRPLDTNRPASRPGAD